MKAKSGKPAKKKFGATIHMGASTFTLSFTNGDSYDLNRLSKDEFNQAIATLRSVF